MKMDHFSEMIRIRHEEKMKNLITEMHDKMVEVDNEWNQIKAISILSEDFLDLEEYPFHKPFNEIVKDVAKWNDKVDKKFIWPEETEI